MPPIRALKKNSPRGSRGAKKRLTAIRGSKYHLMGDVPQPRIPAPPPVLTMHTVPGVEHVSRYNM